MPITWSISHDVRLVTAVADGDMTRSDVEHYWAGIEAVGGMPYAKLLDAKHVVGAFGIADLKAMGKKIVEYGQKGPVGPTAMVVGSELEIEMAQIFSQAATVDRAFRIFNDASKARAWLAEVVAKK